LEVVMPRRLLLAALVFALARALTPVPAAAQQSGGEALAPEVLSTPGAAEMIRERALVRLQLIQQVQQLRAPVIAPASDPNGVNPSLDRSSLNQQTLARVPSRGDAGFLAGFAGGQPLAASRARPVTVAPTLIDQSHTLVLTAVGSPVSIGNGNLVQQQVANSTALGGGVATASTVSSGGKPAGATQQTAPAPR
jgi:hypothetical protein